MNDALNDPLRELILKLRWPTEQDQLADVPQVVVELQVGAGLRLASMSVPSVQLMQEVAQKLAHCPLITPEGFVSVISDGLPEVSPGDSAIAIDQLIAEAISPDMLEDEPNALNMLSEHRARLLNALKLVEQAIVSLRKD